jgi:anaerobic magnesium-protoporphyrin IX monomethyl ester cyclase
MKSLASKNLLLINGLALSNTILDEFLSNSATDSNIYLSYPLGVLTLAAWCGQELPNFNVKILDAMMDLHKHISNKNRQSIDSNGFIKNILDQVSITPDFIGLSINCSNGHKTCLDMARLCKKKWPNSKIIVGGVHVTAFTHKIIADPNIDYAVRGAGDIALVNLLQYLTENKLPNNIPGVVTNINNIFSIADPLGDLNKIPPLPYDLIDMEYLINNDSTSPIDEDGLRIGTVLMSRGCPFSCTFCSADKVHGKRVLFVNVDKIIDNIENLINIYGVNSICIIDDLFGADKKYFDDFFRLIKERKLNFRIVVPAGLSINVFNEDMIDVLIEHGLKAIYFPLESGSKYVQDHIIKKRVNLDKAIRLINHTKQKGIFTGLNIVIGSPGETKEMVYETYDFIKKLHVDWIAFFIAYPYPETQMTNILLTRGDIIEDDLTKIWECSTQGFKQRPFDTKEFSGKELSEIVYDFNIELNFFANYNFRTKNYSNMLTKLNKIINRYPFHVVALACRAKCYHGLDKHLEAVADVDNMINLIQNNVESEKMFKRYKKLITTTINFDKDLVTNSQ